MSKANGGEGSARGLSRKQRRELQRRLHTDDPGLAVVHPNAAGIDIGSGSHFVAVPPDRDEQPVREFGSCTAELKRMAEWLQRCGIETVAMQATGVYWFSVYDILEQHGLKVFLVNAAHTRNIPGRKTDVQEGQWLMKLHTYGLLRNSFRPPEDIRRVRTVWRLRDRHVKEAGRCIQHMQKALTTMNVQLANAISDVSGTTGLAIVRAILGGERDPQKLAAFRDRRIKATREEIARSLEGMWQEDALFELQQAVDSYDFTQKQIRECDEKLEQYLRALPDRPPAAPQEDTPETAEEPGAEAAGGKRKTKKRKQARNAPSFDLAAELTRIYGVDLTSLGGIDVMTVQTVLAELGTDFSAWPTEDHFASWLNLTPKRDVSGGKVIRHVREPAKNRVAAALRLGVSSLLNSDSYLGARFRHLRMRLGTPKAIKAMARYLACLIYRLVTRGQAWLDRGATQFEERHQQRQMSALQRKAARLGFQLVPAGSNGAAA
jgi:transposase